MRRLIMHQHGLSLAAQRIGEATHMNTNSTNQNESRCLLSQTELARALKVHPLTVSRWTTARIIPCHRVGRVIRYDLAAVLAAIAKAENKKGGGK